jgi:hypothetical protein
MWDDLSDGRTLCRCLSIIDVFSRCAILALIRHVTVFLLEIIIFMLSKVIFHELKTYRQLQSERDGIFTL